jgi:hypothetical protein
MHDDRHPVKICSDHDIDDDDDDDDARENLI